MAERQRNKAIRISQAIDGLCGQLQWYATRFTAVFADSSLIFPQETISTLLSNLYNLMAHLHLVRYQVWRQFATTFPGHYTQQSEFLFDPGQTRTFTERSLS